MNSDEGDYATNHNQHESSMATDMPTPNDSIGKAW